MSVELGKSKKKKPETVEFYNKTKWNVDMADQMANSLLDLAGINAFVRYEKQTGDKVSRRNFLFKLTTELCKNYIIER